MYDDDNEPHKPIGVLRYESISRTLDEICDDYSCDHSDLRAVLDGKPVRAFELELEPKPDLRRKPSSVNERVRVLLRSNPNLSYSEISQQIGPDASEYSIRTAISRFRRGI